MALFNQLMRPKTDSTANVSMADVLGGKADAAVTTAAATRSLMAYVKGILSQTKLNSTAAGTIAAGSVLSYLPRCVEKADGAILAATDDPLFTITGGPVLATIFGQVTTVLSGAANATLEIITATPVATVALSTTVAIDTAAAGTVFSFTGVAAGTVPALRVDAAGTRWYAPSTATFDLAEFYLPIGVVGCLTSAARTGNIKWYMFYKPLSPNSLVVAAA
jgi:hypothetical protein